jgi:hypothetical protein
MYQGASVAMRNTWNETPTVFWLGATGGLPRGARVVQNRMDELLEQQNSVPDWEITSPVYESSQHSQLLFRLLSHLIDKCRPFKPCNKGHPIIKGRIGSPKSWTARGFGMHLPALAKGIAVFFKTLVHYWQSSILSATATGVLKYVFRHLTSRAGWRDVAMKAVLSE